MSVSSASSSRVPVHLSGRARYIISTSGRPSSLRRYDILLHSLLDVDIAYIPITDAKVCPEKYISVFKGLSCIGGAISRDIKFAVIPYLDELDETAKQVQSVNTIIEKDGRLIGYNTDASGFSVAITRGIEKTGVVVKSAVCYGYGGVVSVVVAVLKSMGMNVYITGRRPEEAARRASELGAEVFDRTLHRPDLFVNAAPISTADLSEVPNFLDALSSCRLAFDHEMPGLRLKQHCEEKGIYHISGYDMYYPQMALQWQLFLRHLGLSPETLEGLLKQAEELTKDK